MRMGYVAVIALLAVLLFPGAACAQYIDTDSFVAYDGYQLSGYSRTVDYYGWYDVAVESALYDPNYGLMSWGSNSTYEGSIKLAEVDVNSYPSEFDAYYSVEGRHWYWDYYRCGCWEELSGTYDSTYVPPEEPPGGGGPLFNADNPTSLYNYVASQGGGGGSPVAVQALLAASGVVNSTSSPLTTDNLNIFGVGYLAGTGDDVNPELESYVQQMGYSFQNPATAPSTNFASTAIPWVIGATVTVGSTIAMGAVAIASCLLMTGDHAAQWDPSRAAQCEAQQAADIAECDRRFPFGSGQGVKHKACITHSWTRHSKCMKNQPVPPLQPEY